MGWHELDVKEIFRKLGAGQGGLSQQEARERLRRFGTNELKEEKKISPAMIFLRQFCSFLVVILIIAAVISFLIGSILDTIVILIIVILNAIFGFVQEYRAEKAMEALKKLAAPRTLVLREGKKQEIKSKLLVPGDIVLLEEGNRIPADLRLMEVVNMKIDEASLTGESVPVPKEFRTLDAKTSLNERKNMAFLGTVVTYGRGKGVVVETGMRTEMGKIAKMIQVAEEPTPLQKKLKAFGKNLGILILAICAIITVVGILKGEPVFSMLITGIALAVAAIPEGLPAIVTITLAFGLQRMAKQNCIVRQLPAVETLGCTTAICADKTGTLTRNEMVVSRIYSSGMFFDVTGSGYEPKGKFVPQKNGVEAGRDLSLLLRTGALCNNAELQQEGPAGDSQLPSGSQGAGGWKIIGDPTEGALVVSAAKTLDLKKLAKEYPREGEIPFSSERKMMSTANRCPDRRISLFSKGAAETILGLCTGIYRNGRVLKLTESERKRILDANQEMSNNALRVLAMAYRDLKPGEDPKSEKIEKDLIFIGLQGMIDLPREGVKESIRLCKKAGIRVIMITGDHMNTAVAIAKELDIMEDAGSREVRKVLTGSELDSLDDKKLEKLAGDIAVYARVNPAHKVRILRALKKNGHIVAMTGDGVNDAPALKNADIGVSMGIKGTDVAKEASDMVLKDDNFSTIVMAVETGRGIYDDILKFVQYLLSSNMGEVLTLFIALMIGFYDPATGAIILPLVAVQILWINLVTDGLPALALGVEPPAKDIMERKPRDVKEKILSRSTLSFIVMVGVIMAVGTLWVFNSELGLGIAKARTMAFTTLVIFQLFNVLNCRSMKESLFRVGILTNGKLILAIISSIILQLVVLYVPAIQAAFGTVPLGPMDWAKVVAVSASVFIIVEIKKLIWRYRG